MELCIPKFGCTKPKFKSLIQDTYLKEASWDCFQFLSEKQKIIVAIQYLFASKSKQTLNVRVLF
jgi:hypothetical protein